MNDRPFVAAETRSPRAAERAFALKQDVGYNFLATKSYND